MEEVVRHDDRALALRESREKLSDLVAQEDVVERAVRCCTIDERKRDGQAKATATLAERDDIEPALDVAKIRRRPAQSLDERVVQRVERRIAIHQRHHQSGIDAAKGGAVQVFPFIWSHPSDM